MNLTATRQTGLDNDELLHLALHAMRGDRHEEAIDLLKRDTKRYAKRQFTWFRREPEAVWVDITGLGRPEEIVRQIKKYIEISNKLV